MGVFCIKDAVCKLGAALKMKNRRLLYKRRCLQAGRYSKNGKWVFFVKKTLFAYKAVFGK